MLRFSRFGAPCQRWLVLSAWLVVGCGGDSAEPDDLSAGGSGGVTTGTGATSGAGGSQQGGSSGGGVAGQSGSSSSGAAGQSTAGGGAFGAGAVGGSGGAQSSGGDSGAGFGGSGGASGAAGSGGMPPQGGADTADDDTRDDAAGGEGADDVVGDDDAADDDSADDDVADDDTEPEVLDGPGLFEARGCAECHGADGAGDMSGNNLGPEVLHPITEHSDYVVRNGVPTTTMLAHTQDELTDEELDIITEWLQSAPQPTTGEALYMDYCGNCHGADGMKTAPHTLPGHSNDIGPTGIVRDGHATPGGEYMPKFPQDQLSDAEIQLIKQHVASF